MGDGRGGGAGGGGRVTSNEMRVSVYGNDPC